MATWTNAAKNSTTFTNQSKGVAYDKLLLETSDRVLLETGDIILLETGGLTTWTNQTKH